MLTELVADDERNRLITGDIAGEVSYHSQPGAFIITVGSKAALFEFTGNAQTQTPYRQRGNDG